LTELLRKKKEKREKEEEEEEEEKKRNVLQQSKHESRYNCLLESRPPALSVQDYLTNVS